MIEIKVPAVGESISEVTLLKWLKKDDEYVNNNKQPATNTEAVHASKRIIELKVPTVGESISEVTLLKWLRNNGDLVQRDEVIAELESEKATFEMNADEAGELKQVAKEN